MRKTSLLIRFGLLLAVLAAAGCGNKGDLVRPSTSTPGKAAEHKTG